MPAAQARVFQIGFNKCGTRTIAAFFQANGLRCAHWDGGKLAKAMFRNLQAGRSLIHGYQDCQVFTDMEFTPRDGRPPLEGFKLYPQLAAEFPHALFVLNTRDREAWIQSRLSHRSAKNNAYLKKWERIYGVTGADEVAAHWREEWDRHHEAVPAFFAASPYRFLVFNIETDSPELLVRALPELSLDVTKYQRRGSTKTIASEPA